MFYRIEFSDLIFFPDKNWKTLIFQSQDDSTHVIAFVYHRGGHPQFDDGEARTHLHVRTVILTGRIESCQVNDTAGIPNCNGTGLTHVQEHYYS